MKFFAIAALFAAALILSSQPALREQVGPQPDGSFLLNSGWKIRPAGRQVGLDTFPMSSALSKDGRHLLVLNGGYKPPSISVLDAATMQEIGRTPVADGWLGLSFSPDGKRVYVGGGSRACVYEFSFGADGKLTPAREFPLLPADKRTWEDFTGDVTLSPDGRLIYAAMLYRDTIVVINPQSGMVIERFKTGRRPYRISFHPDGKSFLVTSWADGTLYHHNTSTGERLSATRLGPHPTDIVWSARKPAGEEARDATWQMRLFIPAANTNSVYVLGISEGKEFKLLETINIAMTPRQPLGMTPSAATLSADETSLFVVCSDANAVAVADVSGLHAKVLGFVPTGWYPTAARSLADGRLVVLNGRGVRSYPNPLGPAPIKRPETAHLGTTEIHYVGRIQTGTASVIDPFTPEQLDEYSRTVLKNSPYNDTKLEVELGIPKGNPIPQAPGLATPIEHIVYIVKENRTYDQVFGDLGKGNGDPSLVVFGPASTPNHRKLAQEFVLLDNFYVNADVSADGHNWSTAAIAPDYVQKMWPNSYAGRRKKYDYEGSEPAATPPAGYLWSNALAAGLAVRNYGYHVNNRAKPGADGVQVDSVRDPQLAPLTNRYYRAFDLAYKDTERAKVFLKDLAEFEGSGKMPRLLLMRLGNDHTSGTAAGKIAPLSSMADNDQALGMIIEGLSKSRFWAKTAVFVLEDDAQNGADHVDSHRSPAFVLSPYTRRGVIDSTMYNTTSMLRTIELILGLRPMTHFDAGARPMASAFAAQPDLTPYTALAAKIPLDDRNPAASATAARSARLDFSEEDRADDNELNDILWRAIRKTEPPAPMRSMFAR
jgi:DNA-binding beta-propeller fold protein YncE